MKVLLDTAVAFLIIAATYVFIITAVDAYEYEQTGVCKDCNILHLIKPELMEKQQ
jgi:hypothetical protein